MPKILHRHTGRVLTSKSSLDLSFDFCRCCSFHSENDYVLDQQSQTCQITLTPIIYKGKYYPDNGLRWNFECVIAVCMMTVRDKIFVYNMAADDRDAAVLCTFISLKVITGMSFFCC